MYNDSLFNAFARSYEARNESDMSMAEYLESCRDDPMRYANAAERLLAAIGEPQMIDTAKDARLGRIFLNRTMRAYPAFAGFHGMEETIERIVGFFRHAAQGLEERKQILYLLGPVGGGKSSLAERLKSLMEVHPIYVLKAGDELSPVFEPPLGLFDPEQLGPMIEEKYGIPRRRLSGPMSPWCYKRLEAFGGDISRFRVARIDAASYKIKAVFPSGPRPNGAVIIKHKSVGIAACIGDVDQDPVLQIINLKEVTQRAIDLPGRPRWCVTDAAAERIYLCIREPSMVLVARLPDLSDVMHWKLPSGGAHGLDIDHRRQRLYAACDDGALVEVDSNVGKITNVWPIAGAPDVTFFNPSTGLVHVAIGEPGLVETINPQTGASDRTMTGRGAHTTAIVVPDRLYVISPEHGGVLVLADA